LKRTGPGARLAASQPSTDCLCPLCRTPTEPRVLADPAIAARAGDTYGGCNSVLTTPAAIPDPKGLTC